MAEIQKQELTSMNITEDQLQKLKQLFPEAFTEGLKVDWEKLKLTLGEAIDTGKERYGMNWPGKADCFKTIQQPSIATLIPERLESVDFDTTENLFLEGDNLEVLKLLQKSYLGKIKFMYFDPPYNTGNEFIYPDNYSESLETYLEYTGQVDSQGKKFGTNTDTDGRFHSKWMNMMYPRLFLAKNLLTEDGVIFISIDDNEIHNLRAICNEVFGEENFVTEIAWRKSDNQANIGQIARVKEYILCFCKSKINLNLNKIPLTEKAIKEYSYSDTGGKFRRGILLDKTRGRHFYDVKTKTGKILNGPWMIKEEEFKKLDKNDEIYWTSGGDEQPYSKIYLLKSTGQIASDFWDTSFGSNQEASLSLEKLMGKRVFDFPKSTKLLANLCRIGTNKNSIILDIFSGSCTTANAVMDLNSEDGGDRKFICVQIPEPTDANSEAFKAGYKTIADIGKDRLRKAGVKINNDLNEKKLKEESTIFGASKANKNLDLGFKVYKLSKSNFKIWDASLEKEPELIQAKLFEHIQHISPEAEQEAILYELLLKSGFELTTPIEKLTLAGLIVFSIAEGQLLICLEKELTHDCLKAMAELQPTRVICLDEAFKGENADALKTNAVQIMKSKGVVNFRTV